MPCYDGRDNEEPPRTAADIALTNYILASQNEIRKGFEDRLNKLTDMLCKTLTILEKAAPHLDIKNAAYLTPEIKDWWEKHKEWDRQREAEKKR